MLFLSSLSYILIEEYIENVSKRMHEYMEHLTPPVPDKELKQLREAAEKGSAEAKGLLGNRYIKGTGVPQDYKEASKWYRKAAEHGNASAQYNLGIMYYFGGGVPQNHVNAYAWMNLAAAQGREEHPLAAMLRDNILKMMAPHQKELAQKLSTELQNKIKKKTKAGK